MTADIAGRAWHVAQQLVGTPFRLHGRDPAHGLDCIGLIVVAYDRAGQPLSPPDAHYRLRGHDVAVAARILGLTGFAPVTDELVRPGDIIIQHWAGGRIHLLLAGVSTAIHAHAGLGRVVHASLPASGDLHSRWRLAGQPNRPFRLARQSNGGN